MNKKLTALFSKTTKKEILAVLIFYALFSVLYYTVLFWNRNYEGKLGLDDFLDIRDFWFSSGFVYFFNFIAFVLIWALINYFLKHKSIAFKIIIVFILIPLVTLLFRKIRYEFHDFYSLSRLTGSGEVWDLYIPSLFLMFQFGCYFAYTYFIETQKKLQLENELREAALKSELAAIKAQLNPHFLYNVFNTISASIPAENEKTRHMIAQLSDLFRYQLKASQEDFVTLREELDFVTNYLQLEKARFEDRLEIEIQVEEKLYSEKIPPMLLQPIVENAIKHGLASVIKGGKISLSIYKENHKIHFIISDTGIGVADKTKLLQKGIGLTNTQLRLEKIYGSNLEFSQNTPSGLQVKFSI